MRAITPVLHLTRAQSLRVKMIYLRLANEERQVRITPGPFFAKRTKIAAIERRENGALAKVLTISQQRALEAWEQHQRATVGRLMGLRHRA